MKLADKNGIEIKENDLVLFHPHLDERIFITHIQHIAMPTVRTPGVLQLCDKWFRNPHEVEVIDDQRAMLLILEDISRKRF